MFELKRPFTRELTCINRLLEKTGKYWDESHQVDPKAFDGFNPLRSFVTPSLVTTISSMDGGDLSSRGLAKEEEGSSSWLTPNSHLY